MENKLAQRRKDYGIRNARPKDAPAPQPAERPQHTCATSLPPQKGHENGRLQVAPKISCGLTSMDSIGNLDLSNSQILAVERTRDENMNEHAERR